MSLENYDVLLVDLDGVVWLEGEPIQENVSVLRNMLDKGKEVYIVTNNSTRSRRTYSYLLSRIGLDVDESHIITSSYSSALYLRKIEGRGVPVLPVGEAGLVEELVLQNHIVLTMSEWIHAKYVVVGLDRKVNYEHVSAAVRAVLRGAKLISTNTDELLPTSTGPKVGAGGVVGLIEKSTGIRVSIVTGKPSPILASIIKEKIGTKLEKSVFVGDKVSTDGEQARLLGVPALIVSRSHLENKSDYDRITFVESLAKAL
ncbi:MAG: HAD-IIA family hydrolase [Desulfurococcales archaeon]|nr:HAD-IIA family hydrolase [Desulfurococcales archaeon]